MASLNKHTVKLYKVVCQLQKKYLKKYGFVIVCVIPMVACFDSILFILLDSVPKVQFILFKN